MVTCSEAQADRAAQAMAVEEHRFGGQVGVYPIENGPHIVDVILESVDPLRPALAFAMASEVETNALIASRGQLMNRREMAPAMLTETVDDHNAGFLILGDLMIPPF